MHQKVEICGINTSTLKVLAKKECKDLLLQYQSGSLEAKEKIIMGNLKLVLSVLKKINIPATVDINDIFQIGVVGLIKSIDNFNLDLDVAFSTYAIPMIIGEIKRFLRDNTPVKISRQIKDVAYKVLKCKEHLVSETQIDPSIEEISKHIGIDEYDINEAMNSINSVVSIYEPIYTENGDSIRIIDQLSDDFNNQEKLLNYQTLNTGISNLPKIQKEIIKKRYYDGLTQFEIAEELSISQAQVSRLEKNAINELKKLF